MKRKDQIIMMLVFVITLGLFAFIMTYLSIIHFWDSPHVSRDVDINNNINQIEDTSSVTVEPEVTILREESEVMPNDQTVRSSIPAAQDKVDSPQFQPTGQVSFIDNKEIITLDPKDMKDMKDIIVNTGTSDYNFVINNPDFIIPDCNNNFICITPLINPPAVIEPNVFNLSLVVFGLLILKKIWNERNYRRENL